MLRLDFVCSFCGHCFFLPVVGCRPLSALPSRRVRRWLWWLPWLLPCLFLFRRRWFLFSPVAVCPVGGFLGLRFGRACGFWLLAGCRSLPVSRSRCGFFPGRLPSGGRPFFMSITPQKRKNKTKAEARPPLYFTCGSFNDPR